jgi:tRNA (cmo5U34)-methyltransferase
MARGEKKASVDEIRSRFDNDVDRFSNIETGQSATVDAPLTLDLIAAAAANLMPGCTALLDIGCGAGNFTLKLLDSLPKLSRVTLVDLSQPMLDRARERVQVRRECQITALQCDIRDAVFDDAQFDVAVGAAVLHHLRTDGEWRSVFSKLHRALRPGGAFFVSDLVSHSIQGVHAVMWERYGEYLAALRGPGYRDHVFGYIEYEDTPQSLVYQLDLMREVGFRNVDVLHKHSCFAAFVGIR